MRRWVLRYFIPAWALAIGGCGGTTPADEVEPQSAPLQPQPSGQLYRTEILGVDDAALKEILIKSSRLVALEGKPPAVRVGLVRRAQEDLKRLEKTLRSEGYYGAKLAYRLNEDERPILVQVDVSTGPVYRITAYDIVYRPPAQNGRLPKGMAAVGLTPGAPGRALAIVAAQQNLLGRLGEIGHPLAQVADRRVVVDRSAATMSVTLTVDPGPQARFGPTTFEGLVSVEEDYLRPFKTWKQGALYDKRLVDRLLKRLRKTNLFETVRLKKAEEVGADGGLPITVLVTERKHRSIGVGASYSTSEGVGGELFWEHRNLLGQNEILRATATLSQILQELKLDFRKRNHKRLDQDLLSETAAVRQETDAFDELGGSQTFGLERRLTEHWRVAGGGSFEYSRIDDNNGPQEFFLLGIPLRARRDDTDNTLDPSRGSRFQVSATPYQTFGTDELTFLRAETTGSIYYSPLERRRLVVAGRIKLGSIVGAETDDIPATKRFYAGGGGSIRGFGFQKVGPLDAVGDPLGGRSVFETGLELRFRVTDTIGLVPFIEAGNVYDAEVPDFSEPLRIGAGLGVRYFTAIGPVRLDVAVPLDPREGIDDDFQFYISLGQAF